VCACGEPRPDGHDRNPAGQGLGRDGGCRSIVRMGHDAAPSAEGRAGPEPAGARPDGSRDRVPAGGRTWRGPRRADTDGVRITGTVGALDGVRITGTIGVAVARWAGSVRSTAGDRTGCLSPAARTTRIGRATRD